MKNKLKKSFLCCALSVISLFGFSSCVGKFNIPWSLSVEYDGNTYISVGRECGPYTLSADSNGKTVGYLWSKSILYIMYIYWRTPLKMYNENVLAYNANSDALNLWIKEGYFFPDLSDVTIRDIVTEMYLRQSDDKNTYEKIKIADFSGRSVSRDDFVDKNAYVMPDEIEAGVFSYGDTLYCKVNEIENIAFSMDVYFYYDDPYLSWTEPENGEEHKWNTVTYYKVKEEYRYIFADLRK